MEVPLRASEYICNHSETGRQWKVVKGPITNLPIPYGPEVVIEGYVDGEAGPEGLFEKFMGYYAGGVIETQL